MPLAYGGESERPGVALIARTLLDLGVLRETDTCQSLESTISSGLQRWTNEECGGALLSWFNLELVWLPDLFIESQLMLNGYGADSSAFEGSWGGFALVPSEEPAIATLGYWLTEFNRICEGIGFDIYHSIVRACNIVYGMSPVQAYWFANSWDDVEDFGDGEINLRCPKAFQDRLHPELLIPQPPDEDRLRAVVKLFDGKDQRYGGQNANKLHSAAKLALQLIEQTAAVKGINVANHHAEFECIPGVALRWQVEGDRDPTNVVMDDEIDLLRQGEHSALSVLIPWENMDAIEPALQRLKLMLDFLKTLDQLLTLVHGEGAVVMLHEHVEIENGLVRIRV